MLRRRALMFAALAASSGAAPAQQRRSLADPLRLGVDHALIDSGLAAALQRGFGNDTGIAVRLVPGAAQALLQALERGELDAALTNAPHVEVQFESLGFVHERALVAESDFMLIGPTLPPPPKGKSKTKAKPRDPAGLVDATNAADALRRLVDAIGADASLRFLSANDGSGTHLAEQALWRQAGLGPASPWYMNADGSARLLAQARELGAYTLVERGVWMRQGGAPLLAVVQGDATLRVPVHVMRGFRANHPAAKLCSKWFSTARGRAVVAAQRGYRVPAA